MSDLPSTIRVLVAEDNALERSTLVDLLGALGHMVVAEVESGTEAIEKAQQFTPDAVLLGEGQGLKLTQMRLGPARLAGAWAWKSLGGSGARLAFGSGAASSLSSSLETRSAARPDRPPLSAVQAATASVSGAPDPYQAKKRKKRRMRR